MCKLYNYVTMQYDIQYDIQYDHDSISTSNESKIATARKYSACVGGSISSSLSTFQKLRITKDEYDEFGLGNVITKKIWCNDLLLHN